MNVLIYLDPEEAAGKTCSPPSMAADRKACLLGRLRRRGQWYRRPRR